MTSEGKSAREVQELIASVKVESANLAEVVGKILEMLPPKIETFPTGDLSPAESVKIKLIELIDEHTQRESRLSIAAALEMAAKLFDDGKHGHWHYGEISKLIRALTPEQVAQARAEHDREVRIDELQVIRGSCPAEFRDYVERRIRMLTSATEAASPEDSGAGAK